MIVCYYLDTDNGHISFEYGCSFESEVLKDFINHPDIKSYTTITVDTDEEDFLSENAYREIAKDLWEQLGDIPTSPEGAEGAIEQPFLHFEKGTDVYSIWHWFEKEFPISIAKDFLGIA